MQECRWRGGIRAAAPQQRERADRSCRPPGYQCGDGESYHAYSICCFCECYDMSEASLLFTSCAALGLGPRRNESWRAHFLISCEAAAEWRRERETAAQHQENAA